MKLIDKDELHDVISESYPHDIVSVENVLEDIDHAPIINAVEVVHAHWINSSNRKCGNLDPEFRCSNCEEIYWYFGVESFTFCAAPWRKNGQAQRKRGKRVSVYAIDFDGTLCVNEYPEIGEPKQAIINFCKARKAEGHKLILNTCREGEPLIKAAIWCALQGLTFDAMNRNLPELIAQYGGDCRKISADFYIDDRNLFLEGVNT